MRALGLDVGSKTIGMALSDPGGVIASAWGVLERQGHVADAKEVASRVEAESVEQVVVGLPLELDGSEGRRARLTRRFMDVLTQTLEAQSADDVAVPVDTWDERFSTAAAERTLLEADLSRKKRKQKIDAMAAQYILQGWLDAKSHGGRA
jgi:putative Holliday junction resolvase